MIPHCWIKSTTLKSPLICRSTCIRRSSSHFDHGLLLNWRFEINSRVLAFESQVMKSMEPCWVLLLVQIHPPTPIQLTSCPFKRFVLYGNGVGVLSDGDYSFKDHSFVHTTAFLEAVYVFVNIYSISTRLLKSSVIAPLLISCTIWLQAGNLQASGVRLTLRPKDLTYPPLRLWLSSVESILSWKIIFTSHPTWLLPAKWLFLPKGRLMRLFGSMLRLKFSFIPLSLLAHLCWIAVTEYWISAIAT